MRNGDKVVGKVCLLKELECYYGFMYVESVNGKDFEEVKEWLYFLVLILLYFEK